MKKFDLEAALRGEPVCDRDGATIPMYQRIGTNYLLGFQNGRLQDASNGTLNNHQLYMAPQKKTVYVNIYSQGSSTWYETKKMAHDSHSSNVLAIAVPVEIEV